MTSNTILESQEFKKMLNESLNSCASHEGKVKVILFALAGHLKECFRQSNLIENIDDPIADLLMEPTFELLMMNKELSKKNIREAHYMTTLHQNDLADVDKGIYRKVNVIVGDRICPPPYLIKELMHNWILDMQDWKNQDPKKMHIRFEKIHPFIDGNGRTGRLLMWWHEIMLDRIPTLIYNEQKQDYYKWFC
jgi:hypothetical protein